jgi:hypothetical protein
MVQEEETDDDDDDDKQPNNLNVTGSENIHTTVEIRVPSYV